MSYIDFLSSIHKKTKRDYLARVNDPEFPKHKAAVLAKKWDKDYWDGDRRICYGGYHYKEGYWRPVAEAFAEKYQLQPGNKILDVGCGKAFLLYELTQVVPNLQIVGLDISPYAIECAKREIKSGLIQGHASYLPFEDHSFDFVYSINTLHNLHNYELEKALMEIQRVAKQKKYICVESYRNELEKANLLYWQVTCEAFCTPDEWLWWFKHTGYTGDYSFIYFE